MKMLKKTAQLKKKILKSYFNWKLNKESFSLTAAHAFLLLSHRNATQRNATQRPLPEQSYGIDQKRRDATQR